MAAALARAQVGPPGICRSIQAGQLGFSGGAHTFLGNPKVGPILAGPINKLSLPKPPKGSQAC